MEKEELKQKVLNEYIKKKHTQEECVGFIAGFEKCLDSLSLLNSTRPTDEEIEKKSESEVREFYGEFEDFHDEYEFFIKGAKWMRDTYYPAKVSEESFEDFCLEYAKNHNKDYNEIYCISASAIQYYKNLSTPLTKETGEVLCEGCRNEDLCQTKGCQSSPLSVGKSEAVEWISVKENTPELKYDSVGTTSGLKQYSDSVLYVLNTGSQHIGLFCTNLEDEEFFKTGVARHYLEDAKNGHAFVTHWMPLPEAPKTKTK
jgi:hypothetical protein